MIGGSRSGGASTSRARRSTSTSHSSIARLACEGLRGGEDSRSNIPRTGSQPTALRCRSPTTRCSRLRRSCRRHRDRRPAAAAVLAPLDLLRAKLRAAQRSRSPPFEAPAGHRRRRPGRSSKISSPTTARPSSRRPTAPCSSSCAHSSAPGATSPGGRGPALLGRSWAPLLPSRSLRCSNPVRREPPRLVVASGVFLY